VVSPTRAIVAKPKRSRNQPKIESDFKPWLYGAIPSPATTSDAICPRNQRGNLCELID
jgi:hypothetical protein